MLLNILFLVCMIAITIVPLLNTLALSFSTARGSMQPGIKLIPEPFSISGYETLFDRIALWRPLLNNALVTITGTFLHVTVCAITAYALVRENFPGKTFFVVYMMITSMVPPQNIMIPLYVLFRQLHLINSLWAIIISGMVTTYTVFLLRNFFDSIPKSLSESAFMDGASELLVFFRIYLPLSTAGLATVTLFQFVGRWNHFLEAVLYLSTPVKYTLQIALKNLIIDSDITSSTTDSISRNTQMAGVVISVTPLVLLYPFLQRYFISGIMLGAVKG